MTNDPRSSGRDDDVQTAVAIASAAAIGAAGLPEPLRMLCFALIESSLGDAARKSFEMLATSADELFV